MDDQTFDRRSALEWIGSVESEKARIRNNDIYPLVSKWINETTPLTVLDIGSGQGVCSDHIDLDGRFYTGVEPSQFLLDRAKELHCQENRCFTLGNAYALPFQNANFDAVFSVAVWHLLSDLPAAAAELSRVLKQDGNFLIITANPESCSSWTSEYAHGEFCGNRFQGVSVAADGTELEDVLYLHTLDEIIDVLTNSSLKVGSIETFRPSGKSDTADRFVVFRGYKIKR